MKHLYLNDNQLSGTPSLLILPGVVVRVYHCNQVVAVVVFVVVVAVAEVQVVVVAVQGMLQVMVQAKICTDVLSVSYLPGAQVKRSSRRSCGRKCPHAPCMCDGATKEDGQGGREVGWVWGSMADEHATGRKEDRPGRQGGRGTSTADER
jgi:hypothetical protein